MMSVNSRRKSVGRAAASLLQEAAHQPAGRWRRGLQEVVGAEWRTSPEPPPPSPPPFLQLAAGILLLALVCTCPVCQEAYEVWVVCSLTHGTIHQCPVLSYTPYGIPPPLDAPPPPPQPRHPACGG